MKRISIVTILFLVLSISIASAQCPIFSNGTTVASLLQQSWGQTFVPDCSTNINYMTFNTATAVNSEFTFTIRNGSDCSGTVIHTQKLAKIVDGENRVNFGTPIPVVAGNTYYFSVESDLNSTFKVRFSSSSLVPGNLKTHNAGSPKSACDRNFPNYDWNFSVDTTSIVVPPPPPGFPTLGQNVDLFIWAGQSNAQGWKGDGTYYPADPSNLDPFIGLNYAYVNVTSSSGNWIKMQTQEGLFTNGHFGPEVTFSRKLKEDGFNPAIFKYSRGSTSIYSFWKTPGTDGYYDKMIVELKKAIAVLEQQGYTVTIRGFVWIQGESDATATASPSYYNSLLSIVRDIRTNVAKNTNLPIILGVDEQHSGVRNFPIIVESQQRIAIEEGNAIFTSMIGLPKADGTHLTPTGLIDHGLRLFDAYKTLNLTPCSFANIALNKTATASSTWSTTYAASKSVDGNYTTRWASASGVTAATLDIDLGATYTFNQVVLKEYANRVSSYKIQYWNGATWLDAYAGTTIGETAVPINFEDVTGTKVRLNILTSSNSPSIYEFVVNGSDCSTSMSKIKTNIESNAFAISQLSAYPNPVKNNLTLCYPLSISGLTTLDFYNIAGSKIKSIEQVGTTSGSFKAEVNVNDLPNGLYIVKLINGNNIRCVKISVER